VDLSALELAVCAAAVLVGSIIQGSIGLGLNIISAPVMAIVAPEALPATLVLLSTPIAIAGVIHEHHARDRVALPWLLVGALPGTLVGLVIVEAADTRALAIIIGSTALIGVVLSMFSPPVHATPRTSLAAGFLSNLFGTATAVGGPPVALLFQHRTGPIARATLSAFFATSGTLSLVGYLATGELSGDQAELALGLAPIMVVGVWASRRFHAQVDGGWLRPTLLVLSALAGVTAIVRAVA
jgi:uncharacterized membrane protein YfcA